MVYILVEEIAASFGKLEEQRQGFLFGDVSEFFEVTLEIAE